MWSASGPDGDRNEQACQIVCHELPLRALGLSDIQALGWYKQHKDADFVSTWASPKKKCIYPFLGNSPLPAAYSLRETPRSFPEDETECPDGC